jgi:hypothetical protein
MAAGQLPVAVVSMPGYALNTCIDREPSTRNTVVSGSMRPQTSAGACAALATALAANRATAGQADVIP